MAPVGKIAPSFSGQSSSDLGHQALDLGTPVRIFSTEIWPGLLITIKNKNCTIWSAEKNPI